MSQTSNKFLIYIQEGEEVSDAVKVKGPGNCVDQAIAMIKEFTEDMIAQVTEEIEIEKTYHGDIIGKGGKQVQEVSQRLSEYSCISAEISFARPDIKCMLNHTRFQIGVVLFSSKSGILSYRLIKTAYTENVG